MKPWEAAARTLESMSTRRRLGFSVAAALVLFSALLAHGVVRLRDWDRRGILGVAHLPAFGTGKAAQREIFGFKPGGVFLVYPAGPAHRAGLRTGDIVLSINGIALTDTTGLQTLDRRLQRGDTVRYSIRRGTAARSVSMVLKSPLRTAVFLSSLTVSLLVSLSFLGIGMFVLWKKPEDRRVAVFFAMLVVGALQILAGPALALDASNIRGIHSGSQTDNLLPAVAVVTAITAFLPLTLHLSLVFPRNRPILARSPRVLRWVYGIPALMVLGVAFVGVITTIAARGAGAARSLDVSLNVISAVLTIAGLLVGLRVAKHARTEGIRAAFWHRPLQSQVVALALLLGFARVASALSVGWLEFTAGLILGLLPCAILFLGFPVFTCIALYRSYREAGAEERMQVKWPLWGTIIAIGARIVSAVFIQLVAMWLIAGNRDSTAWLMASQVTDILTTLLYLLIPVSFAFAILKHRLMNIDVIVRKTVVYAILSGAIILLYLGLVGGLGTILVRMAGVQSQTMVIASTLVVALLVIPLRNKLQTLVDRNLFRHRYDYPEALKAIAADMLAAKDTNAFLAAAAEKIQQALQCRAVVIFAARHDELVAAAKVGIADTLLGALRLAREPLLPLMQRPFDPRKHNLAPDASSVLNRIGATLAVPVNTPGTPANGLIALAPKLTGGGYEIEDIDFLRSVADQIDLGLDRIRFQREDADYEQARAIQQTLLPRVLPRIDGVDVTGIWQPARTMGGDYFDVLQLGEREIAVCIGDVAGKGMPAALLMSGLQAAVRASASSSPRDLCERVRRVVVSSLAGGRFVTFFYATIDTESHTLRWCNAGHNAPILARADGSVVRLSEGGPAFSRLFQRDAYRESAVTLLPGDRLVLFTDGVSEAGADGGEMLGESRLETLVVEHRHLTVRDLQQRIVDEATAQASSQLEDDLTLVAIAIA